MLLTEKEADKKVCPKSISRDYLSTCRGSNCMAWRWGNGEYDGFRDATQKNEVLWVTRQGDRDDAKARGLEPLGRCGLGGPV